MTGLFCDEVTFDNHVSDVKHIQETVQNLRHPTSSRKGYGPCGEMAHDCIYPDCDCLDSEIIMLSTGYAEVYQDGDVIQFGQTIYKED